MYFSTYSSPVGTLLLRSDGRALTHLTFAGDPQACGEPDRITEQAAQWLDRYFRGEDPAVDFPLAPEGTPFQKQVWNLLQGIPFGQVRTYGSIAREMAEILGRKTMSAQAVGQAVGSNPVSILIPCHRVVGTKGQLTGYAGGLERKIWLLRQEGRQIEYNIVT